NLTARIIQKGLPSPASRWTPSTSLATHSTESGTTRYIPPKRIPSQSKQLSSDETLLLVRERSFDLPQNPDQSDTGVAVGAVDRVMRACGGYTELGSSLQCALHECSAGPDLCCAGVEPVGPYPRPRPALEGGSE